MIERDARVPARHSLPEPAGPREARRAKVACQAVARASGPPSPFGLRRGSLLSLREGGKNARRGERRGGYSYRKKRRSRAVPGETWKICARPLAIMPQKVITVKSARSRCRKKASRATNG